MKVYEGPKIRNVAVVGHSHVLTELVICGSVGVLAGVIFIWVSPKQRKVAIDILDSVRELRNNR